VDRIVGGAAVDAHSIPWQVGIMDKGANWVFCGGSILSSTKILTAAHCYQAPSKTEVIVGEHSLLSATDGVRHAIKSFEKHPNYNAQTIDKDVAIITLKKPIDLGDRARAVCLPKSESVPKLTSGQKMTVSGWGKLSGSSNGPDVLHAVKIPYMTNKQCKKVWGSSMITKNMLCAGAEDGSANGLSSCNGDSGGPLTVNNKTIVGVVSWGKQGCAFQSGVYARVSVFLQWIKSKGVDIDNTNCGGSSSGSTAAPAATTAAPAATTSAATAAPAGTTTTASSSTCANIESEGWCDWFAHFCYNAWMGDYIRYHCQKTCGVCS